MALSKKALGQILSISAGGKGPLDEDILEELAELQGIDPDALIKQHREIQELFRKRDDDNGDPLPTLVS